MIEVAVAVLALTLAALVVLTILLYRQFGLMYLARPTPERDDFLRPGTPAPARLATSIDDAIYPLRWSDPAAGSGTIVIIAADDVPFTSEARDGLRELVDLVHGSGPILYVDNRFGDPGYVGQATDGWRYALSGDGSVQAAFSVRTGLHGFVVDRTGIIAAHEVASTVADFVPMIESLPHGNRRTGARQ